MKEVKNVSASVNARLLNLAKKERKTFQEVLQYYGMERFLYRLSKTLNSNEFVLKGGLIFFALGFSLRRTTKDIDLNGYFHHSHENVKTLMNNACQYPVQDDGLIFHTKSLSITEIKTESEIPGLRVSLQATLAQARIPIQIDIGFSDEINPEVTIIKYPVLLPEYPEVILTAYPPESVISEKFQAMVRLGELNSRWKDFYDVWMLSSHLEFEGEVLKKAIINTFQLRKTDLPNEIPVALTEHYASEKQIYWSIFIKKNKLNSDISGEFVKIINRLNVFLLPVVKSSLRNDSFNKVWKPESGWKNKGN